MTADAMNVDSYEKPCRRSVSGPVGARGQPRQFGGFHRSQGRPHRIRCKRRGRLDDGPAIALAAHPLSRALCIIEYETQPHRQGGVAGGADPCVEHHGYAGLFEDHLDVVGLAMPSPVPIASPAASPLRGRCPPAGAPAPGRRWYRATQQTWCRPIILRRRLIRRHRAAACAHRRSLRA